MAAAGRYKAKPKRCQFRFCEGVGSPVILTLIQFVSRFYAVALCLNKKWRANAQQAIDDYCNPFEIPFVNSYFE